MRTKALAAVLLAVTLCATAGCGKDAAKPAAVVTPKVADDGSYQAGTLPDADATAAIKAAATALPIAFSYDYRSLEASLAKAIALMTPEFGTRFKSTFETTTIPMATEKQAITSALVRGVGIVRPVHAGKAVCLVYLDQVLISSKDKKAGDPLKVSQNSVHVTLRKINGKWKVDDIEPF